MRIREEVDEDYLCFLCSNAFIEYKPGYNECHRHMINFANLQKASKYQTPKIKLKYGGTYESYAEHSTISDLKEIALQRGLEVRSKITKGDIIRVLQNGIVLARTPFTLAEYFSQQIALNYSTMNKMNVDDITVMDIMAGNGNLTRFIPALKVKNVFAVEKDVGRHKSGKILCDRYLDNSEQKNNSPIIHLCMDIFQEEFVSKYILKSNSNFFPVVDVVIANPMYNAVMACIYCGLEILKHSNYADKKIMLLLPSDVFFSANGRKNAYQLLDCYIEKKIEVGKWNYYKDRIGSNEKKTTDAIFIIKPEKGPKGKYSYESYDAYGDPNSNLNQLRLKNMEL